VNAQQVAVLEQSRAALRPVIRAVVADFYRRLFAADPSLRALFSSDPMVLQAKFVAELDALVDGARHPDLLAQRYRALGVRHVRYGTLAEHFEPVRRALLEAMAAALGSRWTADVADAWGAAYELLTELMLQGAATSATR
jgi:hemoglobin-like flavoprotein